MKTEGPESRAAGPDDASEIGRLMRTGDEHIRHGRGSEADACFLQVLALEPDQPDALHRHGFLAFLRGDPASIDEYSEAVRAFKAQIISNAISESGGNRARAAEKLGLHRSNLTRMIRDLGLEELD